MFGRNIKRIRERNNKTQKDLADYLGVSRQAVCMWETGKRDLKATTLNRIAKIFNVSIDEIINSEQEVIEKES